jgi:Cys-tRNA(Pro)/Cys-tRNA(Cys) deacylase
MTGGLWENGPMAETRAIQYLEQQGVSFALRAYAAPPDGSMSYGEAVAGALGVDPARVFKTLIATVDGAPLVGIVPVSGPLSMKGLARAAGGKRAEMAEARDAERLTGYVVGGISPFGRKRRLPVYLDRTALEHETIFVSAGRRGLQLEIAPSLLIDLLDASTAPIAG